MGFRFQKRVRILPGITLNFSKGGVSTSIGTRGARTTFGHGRTRTTVGIPGTGLSYTDVQKNESGATPQQDIPDAPPTSGWATAFKAIGAVLLIVMGAALAVLVAIAAGATKSGRRRR